jgi:predicted metal-dependent HD superfamily phosphohydrolase
VVEQSERIAKKEKINKEDIADLKLAAWLHDVGYIWEPNRHEARGSEYATTILNAMDFPAQKINRITGMIMATKIPQSPKNILEQIICDADLDYLGREGYEENSLLLLQELRLKKEISALDWLKIQDQFLSKHTYFTKTSNTTRNKLKSEVLANIKSTLKNK